MDAQTCGQPCNFLQTCVALLLMMPLFACACTGSAASHVQARFWIDVGLWEEDGTDRCYNSTKRCVCVCARVAPAFVGPLSGLLNSCHTCSSPMQMLLMLRRLQSRIQLDLQECSKRFISHFLFLTIWALANYYITKCQQLSGVVYCIAVPRAHGSKCNDIMKWSQSTPRNIVWGGGRERLSQRHTVRLSCCSLTRWHYINKCPDLFSCMSCSCQNSVLVFYRPSHRCKQIDLTFVMTGSHLNA